MHNFRIKYDPPGIIKIVYVVFQKDENRFIYRDREIKRYIRRQR